MSETRWCTSQIPVAAGSAARLVVEIRERRTWPRGETVHLALAEGDVLALLSASP